MWSSATSTLHEPQLTRPCPADVCTFVAVAILGIAAYWTAELAIGKTLLPGGEAWSLAIIWVGAQVGGLSLAYIRLPPLLGMLLSGVVLVNLPGDLVEGLPAEWSSRIRAGALAIILCRCVPS